MTMLRAFFGGLGEVLLLRDAERRARTIDEARRSEAAELVVAARLRLRASRRVGHPAPAIELLRLAHGYAARAAELTTDGVPEPLAPLTDLELDRAPLADLEARREELDGTVRSLLDATETRSVFALRVRRYGRIAALVLLVLFLGVRFVRARVGDHNLALGKPVIPSSIKFNPPNPSEVVDGKTRGTFGIVTGDEAAPQIVIDLEAEHTIRTIKVYNRGDGWFDDCIPLIVDTSVDGVTYDMVGRRTTHFDLWSLDAGGRTARYVRVRRDEPGYITLNEIEVIGR